MIAAQLHLSLAVVAGVLIFGGCLFTAGWVFRGLAEPGLRARRARLARRRWSGRPERRRGVLTSRSPW